MRNFWSDSEGNAVLLFSLAMIPVFGAMGAALDYSMASAYRADLQKALDATALALTKIMPTDQATLDTVGDNYFKANLGPHTLTNVQLTITPEVGKLKLSAKGTYTVHMANLIGASTVDLGTSSEAKWSVGKVEIALALDNSWSMNSLNRMVELKKAAKNLLQVLQNAAKNEGDAKVAIVPFDARVNVGTGNAAANWIKWGTCSAGQCGPSDATSWNGCVWDRDKSNDTRDTAPSTVDATKYPAWQCNHGLGNPNLVSEMMPLTTNWTALNAKVDAMQPAGYTNITIGLVWAWHALSNTELMTEGTANDTPNQQKYIILLSDGENTRNRFNDSESTMNTRTRNTCDNIKAVMKADGTPAIKIFTIRLMDGDGALLSYCASDATMYKDVESASELSAVFSSIGAEIANLHLSK